MQEVGKKERRKKKKIINRDSSYGNNMGLKFWTSVRNRVPHLAAAAILRLQMHVNSADVERSFSCLRNIDTCRRQNLKDDNLKNMLKVSFNSL